MNFQQEVTKVAKKRGWKLIRRGGHEQMILEYPQNRARIAVWSSPHSQPALKQITARMSALEIRGQSANDVAGFLDWICDRHGISTEGSGKISVYLEREAQAYLKATEPTLETKNLTAAASKSDRLWIISVSRRGGGRPTDRLLFGNRHLMTKREKQTVELWPQVNGYLPRASAKVIKSETAVPTIEETPEVLEVELATPSGVQVIAADEPEGIPVAPVPIHSNGTGGMPPELVAMLESHFGKANKDVLDAVEYARETLEKAQKSVAEAIELLDLVKLN